MQLSGVPLSFSRPSLSASVHSRPHTPLVPDTEAIITRQASTPAFIFPQPSESVRSLPLEQPRERTGTPSSSSIYLAESTSTLDARPLPPPPSNLSILMAQHSRSPSRERADEEEDDSATPVVSQPSPLLYQLQREQRQEHEHQRRSYTPPLGAMTPLLRSLTERTPLLPSSFHPTSASTSTHHTPRKWVSHAKSTGSLVMRSLPAVILGLLLNVLDGISYGMIIFPASGVFMDLGAMGVSMFFVSTIVSQVVYSIGASGFAGANGSMMIEVVPFFHIMATRIAQEIGDSNPDEIVATTLFAFAFSSVLTGFTFFLLGFFRLGTLIGFFPRHILVGCIGGVGVFLIITGLNVSTRLQDDEFSLSLDTLFFFLRGSNLALWAPAFALAGLLRVITSRWHHQLILPTYFLVIPAVFYIVILCAGLDLDFLRRERWLFQIASSEEKWYKFYTYFDLTKTRWGALWATLPTQLALLFFNVLHPPLNVPALAVSLDCDVDTNKELIAHGYSNFLSGIVGSVPNYLVYVNTLLFYRVGGTTRLSGLMLAGATVAVLLAGTGPIAYIPVMVVSALIFVLGIDLVKEALWDTRHRVSKPEYITIASIMVAMTAWDFVIGVLFGIIVSCLFFVVQNSQRHSIRVMHTGEATLSTVRRPNAHREYLREVSQQTTIMHLHGFLFFGTITHVEGTIRQLVAEPAWVLAPVRFLVLDFALVLGVDLSAAEALVRVQRLLSGRKVVLVICGAGDGKVLSALDSVGLFELPDVELFTSYNDAMEWTENVYLRAWFDSNGAETKPIALPGRQDGVYMDLQQSLPHSPRRAQLRDAGWRIIAKGTSIPSPQRPNTNTTRLPLHTLEQAFSPYTTDRTLLEQLASYFERIAVPEGYVVWKQGEPADGLYVVGTGVLRATYQFAPHTPAIEESMVPGTLAGELSGLAGLPRNATVVAERPAVLWRLSTDSLRELEDKKPDLARDFTALVLKAAKLDFDILLSAVATRP
ncbi:Sulfate transporter family domain containing protein [Lactarius tabidus]